MKTRSVKDSTRTGLKRKRPVKGMLGILLDQMSCNRAFIHDMDDVLGHFKYASFVTNALRSASGIFFHNSIYVLNINET